MLTYYNAETSPNCFKNKILLNELGIEYEQKDYDQSKLGTSDYIEKFPNAKIPGIEDGGLFICESGAIAQYLAEKHSKLLPSDLKKRALAYQALNIESSLQAPTIGGQGIFGEFGKPEDQRDMARVEKLMPEAQRIAAVLSSLLGESDYFAGEFSIADIQIYPGLSKAIQYQVIQNPPQNIIDWVNRMDQRASVMEARKHYPMYHQ